MRSVGVIFDGDDTLWETEWLYDDARAQARSIVEAAGFDGERWEQLERRIDVENVERLGHSPTRFPTSCVEAYEALALAEQSPVDATTRKQIERAARSVFTRPAPVMPHALEALTELRNRGLRLGLLTRGAPAVQRMRLEQSGLTHLFEVVEIVDRKTPGSFRSTLGRLGLTPGSTLSVGNSIRSDVLPSLAAGVRPIWIDAHVWEYEQRHGGVPDGAIELEDLSRLPAIVAKLLSPDGERDTAPEVGDVHGPAIVSHAA